MFLDDAIGVGTSLREALISRITLLKSKDRLCDLCCLVIAKIHSNRLVEMVTDQD